MALPLTLTDAEVPRRVRHEIARPRLVDVLDNATAKRVTLVTAAAGSGKSVALAQWARERAAQVRWCQFGNGPDALRPFWAEWTNAERASGAADKEVSYLVLDDADRLSDRSVLAAIGHLLGSSAHWLRIVLVGRARPLLRELPRLRANDEVSTVDTDDLRFNPLEISELLDAMGAPHDENVVGAVAARSEGWATGVRLLGSALRDGTATRDALEDDDELNVDVVDYFRADVMRRVPDHLRSFILAASVARELSDELCERLTTRSDAPAVLHEVERHSLFLHTDGHGSWRFHALFRAFLDSELERARPADHRDAHRTVAEYSAANGDLAGSLRHWISSGDGVGLWSHAVTALATQSTPSPQERAALERMLLSDRSMLDGESQALAVAATFLCLGRVDAAEAVVERECFAIGAGNDRESAARLAYLESLIAFARGDLMLAARVGREAQRLLDSSLPGEWERLRGPLIRIRALSLLGLYERARSTHADCVKGSRIPSLAHDAPSDAALAQLELEVGNLASADYFAQRAIDAAMATRTRAPADALFVRGVVLAERSDAEAVRALRSAIVEADTSPFSHLRVLPRLVLASLLHSHGDLREAGDLIEEARSQVGDQATQLAERVDDTEAMMAIRDGDFESAEQAIERLREPQRTHRRARLLAMSGVHAGASDAIAGVRRHTRRDAVDLLLLRARVEPAGERQEQLVREVLRVSEPDRYVRIYVDERSWLGSVLVRVVADWPTPYAAEILGRLAVEPRPRDRAATSELTPRERQVLRYLATSMSMRQIADALFVSHNTVKSHVRSIYRKVGVRDRGQLAAHAFPTPSNSYSQP